MRVNSDKSIATANAVYDRFGSWQAARKAARFEDVVYVVRLSDAPRAEKLPKKA